MCEKIKLINMRIIFLIVITICIVGCSSRFEISHDQYMYKIHKKLGTKAIDRNSPNFQNLLAKDKDDFGITHITIDSEGNEVRHWFMHKYLSEWAETEETYLSKEYNEILKKERRERIGDCRIYKVIDRNTNIFLDWGFDLDAGGNPLSCYKTPPIKHKKLLVKEN